ncbi:hypothetical protein WJX75_007808 [Coccomyxa subellipsoidea]|uniref:Uncharacterized protein n=1 Tax=Coccomyxa subellipsoidea TaxID=248742 RepID=A0ABR2YGS4_9CHLO
MFVPHVNSISVLGSPYSCLPTSSIVTRPITKGRKCCRIGNHLCGNHRCIYSAGKVDLRSFAGRKKTACASESRSLHPDGKHDAESLSDAIRRQAGEEGDGYDLERTKRLVETAMLAAVGGVVYTVASILKLQSYLGYFQPMPIVVSAMRWGPAAGRKTMTATCFLLLVLQGPLQSLTYLLNQGLLAATLGASWSMGVHWVVSVSTGAFVRVAGMMAYVLMSSWVMNENLFSILMTNIYSLLDQMNAFIGASGAPPPTVVMVVLGTLLIVNAFLGQMIAD